MGVFDQELILPGTITEIESDYSYGYDTSKFGTTDSVTIIGTAFNGPVGKPVEIYSPEHAKYIFGETYDYKTRREATLVAEIQDAWDRGCRTIYAVRVSGKPIYKDFQLAVETKLKLRVSGIFPTNANKDVYMLYDDTTGAMEVKVFKPALRATIQEKMEGLVEKEESILVTNLNLSNSYGLTKDSRLVELIKLINENSTNNVLRLSIVDEYGNDVTIASKEAQALSVGVVFPGTYFIGRDVNKCVSTTNLEYQFATNMNKPFEGFDGKVFKKLVINTDIVEDLPIFGTRDDLNKKFITAGVSMTKLFDILEIPGQVDLLFGKDAVDYEEVDISDFDLYQRLGSGFAITSKAELKVQGGSDIRVKETPVSDDNRITAINDGIYSMLENLRSDYRVIANGVADGQILGKIPKKVDFKVAKAKDKAIFDGKIIAKAKIDTKDLTDVKKYKFELDDMDEAYNTITEANVYTTNVIKKVANIAELTALDGKIFANGTLFMQLTTSGEPATTVGTLYRYANGSVVKLDDPTANADLVGKLFMADNKVFKGKLDNVGTPTKVEFEQVVLATEFGAKLYVLVESFETVAIYAVSGTTLVPVGELGEVFDDNEDKTLIVVQSENIVDNTIAIKSAALDYTTLEEFVAILNADKTLAKLFSFEVAEASVLEKDDYMSDLIAVLPKTEATAMEDREISYDLSLYIPYKTTDNFARHLAQHCTYTSLKTAPTHGIIGCSKLLDVNLNSIARKVDTLADIDMTLYAKKPNGRDMLDRNNLPYPIGRNISVVVGQYVIDGGNGYNYISNAASGYAGMVSVLPLDQSSTCQPINIPQPQYEFTNYQLGKLTQLGFVTFKQSYTKGFVVTDGITMAPVTSPFRRLSVTRIINSMEELIRAAIEPYIGKQNHLANRNAMQTAIKSALESIKDKLIEAYDFTVTVDPNNAKLGIVDIDYVVVPIFEIREVRNRITVKESMAA